MIDWLRKQLAATLITMPDMDDIIVDDDLFARTTMEQIETERRLAALRREYDLLRQQRRMTVIDHPRRRATDV